MIADFLADKPLTREDKGKDFIEFVLERLESDYSRNRIGRSRYENGKSGMNIFRIFLRATKNGTEGMNVEVVELPSYAGTDVTGANVGGNYVGNFSDEATGKVLGNALIAEGVDILFVAAGGSGNGVFTAAKEADGVKVIGCDVDQYDDGANGDSNIVLTSGLKVMHDTVYNVLNEVKDGSFKGANVTLTAADDATGFVSEEGRCQLTAEAIEKINAAQALLKEGKIVPAANFNGVTPETFTW